MLVATRSFVARDPFAGPVPVTAGKSFIAESHPIVLAHPDAFEPAAGRQRGAREATIGGGSARVLDHRASLPEQPAGLETWRLSSRSEACSLDTAPGEARVWLSDEVRDELLTEAKRSVADRVETGGLTFVRAHDRGQLVRVLAASGPGPNAERTPTTFAYDIEHNRQVTAAMAARGLSLCGEWHTHPSGAGRASDADLDAWAERRRTLGLDRYIAAIVTETRAGWLIVPYLVTRGGFGRDVAERAIVI
jgi:proteasome lid subunit RPN8/RPN11